MEQPSNSTETMPSFLRTFVEQTESQAQEILSHPEAERPFELPAGMKTIREGNASDALRLKTHAVIYAAEQLLGKLREEGKGTKEDFLNEEIAAKFVAFCRAQEPLSRLYAEAKDNPALNDLKEVYEKYIADFSASTQGE